MTWEAETTNTFRRGYRNLTQEIRARADDAMAHLLGKRESCKTGTQEGGEVEGPYSYEIGRQSRLLYTIRFEDHTVVFLDIGTHGVYR